MSERRRFSVCLEPIGSRLQIESGVTVLSAIQDAGIEVAAICGGEGICGKCIIRLLEGQLTPVSEAEKELLPEIDIAAGYRLACRAQLESDVTIYIPPESLSTEQRLQTEGMGVDFEVDPVVRLFDVEVDKPDIHDLRSDANRFLDACRGQSSSIAFPLLSSLSTQLREQDWRVRAASDGEEILAVFARNATALGLAVDLGTTKLATYLVDLESGGILERTGRVNPQVGYGDDVINRIAYANQESGGRQTLQRKVVEAINDMAEELCTSTQFSKEDIVEAVVVGNTAMHHLFVGLPVRQLGEAPYVPAVSDAVRIRSSEIGLQLAPGSKTYLPPNVAGYVGADHVAMVLATRMLGREETALAIDIGTNTEVSLVSDGRLLTCSCASGPAFEGAHIQFGMRAIPGAIERVEIDEGEVLIRTIENQKPIGICGSGILDAVAQMRKEGVIESSGRLNRESPGVTENDSGGLYCLVPAEASGSRRAITLSRKDVNEIQLAKAAIRTGIEILLQEAGRTAQEIESFVIAGAFGTYLDVESAKEIGMFPDLPLDRFYQVGNAAGTGAREMLVSKGARLQAEEIRQSISYVELTVHPNFFDVYAAELMF